MYTLKKSLGQHFLKDENISCKIAHGQLLGAFVENRVLQFSCGKQWLHGIAQRFAALVEGCLYQVDEFSFIIYLVRISRILQPEPAQESTHCRTCTPHTYRLVNGQRI